MTKQPSVDGHDVHSINKVNLLPVFLTVLVPLAAQVRFGSLDTFEGRLLLFFDELGEIGPLVDKNFAKGGTELMAVANVSEPWALRPAPRG